MSIETGTGAANCEYVVSTEVCVLLLHALPVVMTQVPLPYRTLQRTASLAGLENILLHIWLLEVHNPACHVTRCPAKT